MRITHAGIIAATLAAALLLTGCETKVVTAPAQSTALETVTAQGMGKTLAAPDAAEISLGVSFTEPSAKDALDKTSKAADKLSSAVQKAGVAKEDVQTANISVYPQYREKSGKPEITGYQASIDVRVKVRDIERVGDVIAAGSDAGATNVSGPNFVLDNDAAASAKAIENAMDKARERGEAMAKAAGRKLGEIRAVSDSGVSTPIYHGAWSDGMKGYAAEAIAVEPGQLDITATVTVIFDLE